MVHRVATPSVACRPETTVARFVGHDREGKLTHTVEKLARMAEKLTRTAEKLTHMAEVCM